MFGLGLTVMGVVGNDRHSVERSLKVKLAVPGATPNTIPEFETVAIEELLLVQIPPVDGVT